jgi:protoheme IX farnesyltransferase
LQEYSTLIDFIRQRIRLYRQLSKSGIVTLVVIAVLAGYLTGHPFYLDFSVQHFVITLLGVLLLASGSSALNQLQEIELDREMPRTKNRPLVTGAIGKPEAWTLVSLSLLIGGVLLYFSGFGVLYLGIAAAVFYNGLYTLWWKRHWAFAAVPGAIPGALPVLMGYAAASGEVFSPQGLYLFFVLFFWQMPHFWSLAIRFQKDYAQGGIPTLPVATGTGVTVRQIVIWCVFYVMLAFAAPLFFDVKWVYLVPTTLVSIMILFELVRFAKDPADKGWLRFFLWVNFSLIVYLGAIPADLWSIYLLIPLTR